jgi:hypothetical protein
MSRRSEVSPPPLFFLHIPKTAGLSLRNWLGVHFAASRVFWINHHDPTGGVRGRLDDYDLVAGHACYGFVDRFRREPQVVTFLRDPSDRALSAFYYMRQLGKELLPEYRQPALLRACELGLADFIREEPRAAQIHLGETQTWMLSREQPGDSAGGRIELAPADLQAAKANLARCEYVGLTERLDESLALLCRSRGWPVSTVTERVNRTADQPARGDIDARARRLLDELTAPDRELYRFACGLFERRLEEARGTPGPTTWTFWASLRDRGGPQPESACLTFDQAIPGHGWLGREESERGHYCWMERDAWVELRVAVRGDMKVRCTVFYAVTARQLAQVTLAVNGARLPTTLRIRPEGLIYEADVPYQVLGRSGRGPVCVRVAVAEALRPCDEVSGSTDSRLLGLAIHRLELLPIRAAMSRTA